jgi:hypothetical protein
MGTEHQLLMKLVPNWIYGSKRMVPCCRTDEDRKLSWVEAVCNAAYVRNRVITTATAVTPYKRWYGKKPDVSNLRVFGCTAYVHVPDASRQKLDQKAVKM